MDLPLGRRDGDEGADAVLGAAGEVDIGTLFPDTDEAYANADSRGLSQQVKRIITEKGFRNSEIND